jgi:YHS domain-containing protein
MKTFKIILFLFLSISAFESARAQDFKSGDIFVDESGTAIKGYDPVEYHLTLRAVRGDSSLSLQYGGATFFFRNVVNKKLFQTAPEKYLPAYGGFCSDGLIIPEKGSLPEPGRYASDPENFLLFQNRLFLFCPDEKWQNDGDWKLRQEDVIRRADSIWAEIRNS